MKIYVLMALTLFTLTSCKEAKEYTQVSMVKLDGKDAVGGNLKFNGIYMQIYNSPTSNERSIIVRDEVSRDLWHVVFEDEHKEKIAQMQEGGTYPFDCIIDKVDGYASKCLMK